ncbi:hypothetical protein EU527_08685 [Candidatus Thorarchaeota archaeon]|nr:MAG: hypothetical protein EU527_08685 [Candidatus Thorarchaeota archaeon]
MATRYEFDEKSIENFCINNQVVITLNQDQLDNLAIKGKTSLLVEQISDIADHLYPDKESQKKFLEHQTDYFHPISLSLYVLNDDLWKIMFRKNKYPDRMLPMTTIPWFYWQMEEEGRMNPSGFIKLEESRNPFCMVIDKGVFTVSGRGGDFAGLLEGRIVDRHKGIRPLLIPGSTGPKKIVANYESQMIQIKIETRSLKTELYPRPMKNLDYFHSEHPRVFYEHGIQMTLNGDDVNLKVGKRRDTTLRGEVIIFIGKDFSETIDSYKILMFHVWLSILNRVSFL